MLKKLQSKKGFTLMEMLIVTNGTITYTASKLTDAANADSKTFTWTLGTPDIH